MFRKDHEGKTAAENGGALVYSLGPTGMVAVILYPAKSSLGQPLEDHIYLRVAHYSGYQIQKKLPKDLRDLVAYSYVSSLDAEPSFLEKIRIWWLRHTHPMQVDGKYRSPLSFRYAGNAIEFTARTMTITLLKPLAILIVITLLIYFGAPELITYLKP